MHKPTQDPPVDSFGEITRRAISCVDKLTRKIVPRDNELILKRLRRGEFVSSSRLSEVDPFPEDSRSRLAEYNHSIAQLEEALGSLKNARDSFRHSVDVTTSLCAPVRCLPEDVLTEIFSFYVKSMGFKGGPILSTPNFRLAYVCSFWRKAVFSRPTLWSSFLLTVDAFRGQEVESEVLTLLSNCLLRSANTPLSLFV
ncbi:hypothetical protein GYMLUDRAFT_180305 [Collybiopsis luxurians FD-317 M1]|uniref:F-box domain-containing protein n=1 Tax=Collybiopsis luxurians FD-317 M1 TaxID=944289 RepID=A0A0D0CBP0_9AGAR|nr:hypothetical protein GYMLUDRAFT_180305 [Collybiopsis luxurians FD-317 M1]